MTATTDTDLLKLDRQLCFALAVASRSVIGAYKPILEPMGLTHPQYLVMLALWEREPRSLTALAEVLRLEPATLSPLVKRLEAAGLVTRGRSADDERQLAVMLTDAGRMLRTRAEEVPPQVVAALGVDLDELTELHARLSAIIERIAPLSSGEPVAAGATAE
ncbi:MarR family transcriptional regulator [Herbiconiux sp. KACC 21604]|uniref:MarR family winged helix-turn-helix transcriptional regulator n=1 Tax=unclassified Herbiconiux TaxID=2618217 RepID=UPI001491BB85|nr:MarR family transcriptional regulator [Herbiconiux sp. SALV-R1]QJU54198.1 MarR family transcriptional regulator [Herbiconiux sp. SALV-R1]WPO85255.1 MarR family transcriptional regulator [Herbiconiux sp. KACC 21604]